MAVALSSDTSLGGPIGPSERLVGGVRHDEIVLLLTEAVLPLSVLEDEEVVANEGRSVRVGEYHPHSRVVCRVLAIRRLRLKR
jgi:hypothetical protein